MQPVFGADEHTDKPAKGWYVWLMRACGALAALLFGAMGLLITCDVVLRNMGLHWIAASTEISEYMLMVATFVAAPWLLYQGAHIRIDLVVQQLPARLAQGLELACNVLAAVVCAVLAWQALRVTRDAAEQGSMVFKELMFPQWWLNLPLLFGASLMAVEFVRRAVQMVRVFARRP